MARELPARTEIPQFVVLYRDVAYPGFTRDVTVKGRLVHLVWGKDRKLVHIPADQADIREWTETYGRGAEPIFTGDRVVVKGKTVEVKRDGDQFVTGKADKLREEVEVAASIWNTRNIDRV